MKKIVLIAFLTVFSVFILAGCGDTTPVEPVSIPEYSEEVSEETKEELVEASTDETKENNLAETEEATEDETAGKNGETEECETEVDTNEEYLNPAPELYAQDPVNVRKDATANSKRLGELQINSFIRPVAITKDGDWYRFLYGGQYAYARASYFAEERVSEEMIAKKKEEAKAAAEAAAAQAAAQPGPAANAAPSAAKRAGVLMIGDSRCVQMQAVTGGGGVSWICENAKGYDWMMSTALPRADAIIGKGTKVVICLGVNDTKNANNYAAVINQKAAEWAARGARTYFVSVNPVWENPHVTEEQVVNFNNTVAPQLAGVRWIDTHSVLINTGYHSTDGLHYNDEDNLRIFNMIIGSL